MMSCTVNNGLPLAPAAEPVSVPWWSFGKTVLAATALTLVRDGLVALDDPVEEGPFTLRQLLRHEAGLADYGELAEYHAAVARHETAWSAEEMLQRLDAARLRYAPGSGWGYSNVGYLYIARLIERTTGLALEEALIQRALAPLDIVQVRLAKVPGDLQDMAPGYDPAWVYHGLLLGPLQQAVTFLDRLLAGQLLPDHLLSQMQTLRQLGGPIAGRPWESAGYGLGVMSGTISGGLQLCGHTGGGPGSVVAVYRATDGEHSASCGAFLQGGMDGEVEAAVVRDLRLALVSAQ
ncbi:serine hydrolase domain-containing protein [Pseudomonas sp. IT-P176]|uniref:serine hydrolase domain-containing protein n=1 Tax=Pseudomonas sp. IT-P176 TaxID=3026444 RepID=UPI0039E03BA8